MTPIYARFFFLLTMFTKKSTRWDSLSTSSQTFLEKFGAFQHPQPVIQNFSPRVKGRPSQPIQGVFGKIIGVGLFFLSP